MNLQLVSVQQPVEQQQENDARPFVDLKKVSLAYDGDEGTLTLDRVSMGIGQGEFVAVVGPSGCGKSTLMKLVTGLLPATSGEVVVDGKVVQAPDKRRRHGVSKLHAACRGARHSRTCCFRSRSSSRSNASAGESAPNMWRARKPCSMPWVGFLWRQVSLAVIGRNAAAR